MADEKIEDRIPKEATAHGAGAVSFRQQCSCGAAPGEDHKTDCVAVEVITPKPGPDLDAYMKARADAQGAPQALATAAVNLYAAKQAAKAAKTWRERKAAQAQISIWRKTVEIAADKYAESWEQLRACQQRLVDAALTDPDHTERGPAPAVSAEDAAAGKWPGARKGLALAAFLIGASIAYAGAHHYAAAAARVALIPPPPPPDCDPDTDPDCPPPCECIGDMCRDCVPPAARGIRFAVNPKGGSTMETKANGTKAETAPRTPAEIARAAALKALADADAMVDNERKEVAQAAEDLAALKSNTGGNTVDAVARRGLIAIAKLLRDVHHNEGAHAAAQQKITALVAVLQESLDPAPSDKPSAPPPTA